MAKENKDFEFRKPFAICKEFREKVDKCVNQHRNLFDDFPHGYCNYICIWVFGHMII